jgi:hypothetical protein
MVGWKSFWLIDRSSFYGIYLKPFVLRTDLLGLWLGLLPQLAATIAMLVLLSRKLQSRYWEVALPSLLLFTTAPWHVSQLMPDAYAATVILLGWYLASRNPNEAGVPLIWLGAVLAMLTHSTFPVLMVAAFCFALAIRWSEGLSSKIIILRLFGLCLSIAATVLTQLSANAYFLEKASYSPRGSAFLYARLNEDGLTQGYLEKHCTTDSRIQELCQIAPSFPRDAQELLWADRTPFRKTVWAQKRGKVPVDWDEQLGIVANGALREEPIRFLALSAKSTIRQFFSFKVLDDQCPESCLVKGSMKPALRYGRPDLREKINSAPQIRGELPRHMIEPPSDLANSKLAAAGQACIRTAVIGSRWPRRECSGDWQLLGSFRPLPESGCMARSCRVPANHSSVVAFLSRCAVNRERT